MNVGQYDKIVIEYKKKKSKYFLHKSLSKRLFRDGIHSLLRRADARGGADIIKFVVGLNDAYRYFAGQA